MLLKKIWDLQTSYKFNLTKAVEQTTTASIIFYNKITIFKKILFQFNRIHYFYTPSKKYIPKSKQSLKYININIVK